jgi:hypothetical protein
MKRDNPRFRASIISHPPLRRTIAIPALRQRAARHSTTGFEEPGISPRLRRHIWDSVAAQPSGRLVQSCTWGIASDRETPASAIRRVRVIPALHVIRIVPSQ